MFRKYLGGLKMNIFIRLSYDFFNPHTRCPLTFFLLLFV